MSKVKVKKPLLTKVKIFNDCRRGIIDAKTASMFLELIDANTLGRRWKKSSVAVRRPSK